MGLCRHEQRRPRIIAEHLSADDDPQLWEVAIRTLLAEAADAAAEVRTEVYAEVGCCHHWISPHRPIRWTADGGFAWPFGYNKTVTGSAYRASPEFTWSALSVDGRGLGAGPNGTAMLIFRVAVPARTARHLQAAIHTIWTPRSPRSKDKVVQLFGFRKQAGACSSPHESQNQKSVDRHKTRPRNDGMNDEPKRLDSVESCWQPVAVVSLEVEPKRKPARPSEKCRLGHR